MKIDAYIANGEIVQCNCTNKHVSNKYAAVFSFLFILLEILEMARVSSLVARVS